mmetsp:Transcript_26922/g.63181  ORF Transcript_26922/g.63181 Transcript_26922/m.63181 type:complete len:340 (-) Transcript_26922:63-1082(-)
MNTFHDHLPVALKLLLLLVAHFAARAFGFIKLEVRKLDLKLAHAAVIILKGCSAEEKTHHSNTSESQQPMIVEEGVYHQLRNHHHHAAKSDCQCAGAKKRRPDLQEHIVLILVALHEGCILEDTPKSLHISRIPQDQQALRASQKAADAQDAFGLQLIIHLIDANFVQEYRVLGSPKHQGKAGCEHSRSEGPKRELIEVMMPHVVNRRLDITRKEVGAFQSRCNKGGQRPKHSCRWTVLQNYKCSDLSPGVLLPRMGPELIQRLGHSAEVIEALPTGSAVAQDVSQAPQHEGSPGRPLNLRADSGHPADKLGQVLHVRVQVGPSTLLIVQDPDLARKFW